jgi:peroxiredoxin
MKHFLKFALLFLVLSSLSFAPQGYKIGDSAMDFSLKNVDGKKYSLASMQDAKGYIVIFTCNHCPYAKLYEDRFIELHKAMNAKGFPVVAINPNDPTAYPEDSFENMQKRAQEKSYPFVYLLDQTQEVAKAYGAAKTPHIYVLVKENGKNIVKYIGALDDSPNDPAAVKTKYVEDAIEAILAGKPVKTNMTKAIGCGIKWKK